MPLVIIAAMGLLAVVSSVVLMYLLMTRRF